MLDVAARARFERDWTALVGRASHERAVVALSGGPDSTALLLLLRDAIGERCHAATVDHRLRAESGTEAAAAAVLCGALGVPHAILTGDLPDRAAGSRNISARARALRYRLLHEHAERVGARWIVTAHHADDQCETLVMRLNRASGVAGLAGTRSVVGKLVRPLLGWRREHLAAIVAGAGIKPVMDPSNRDDRFDRARLRKRLVDADWLDPAAVAASARLLGEAEAALEWMTGRLAAGACTFGDRAATLDPTGLPAELTRRLTLRCLRHIDPSIAPRGVDLVRLIDSLEWGGDTRTLGQVRVHVEQDRERFRPTWHFRPAPPHRTR